MNYGLLEERAMYIVHRYAWKNRDSWFWFAHHWLTAVWDSTSAHGRMGISEDEREKATNANPLLSITLKKRFRFVTRVATYRTA
jgi:hypothetical protein